MPIDRSTILEIESKDVLHSFWVPEFGQKQDAVPGQTNPLKITPTKLGTYPVICTELCGLGHALMRRTAIVLTAARFADKHWANGGSAAPQPPAPQPPPPPPPSGPTGATGATGATGRAARPTASRSSTANGCQSCHTLTAAGAIGKVGPDLDKLPAEAQKAGQPLEDFVHTSVVDPEAYIEPGFPKGVMPPNFGQVISKADLDTLVQYPDPVVPGRRAVTSIAAQPEHTRVETAAPPPRGWRRFLAAGLPALPVDDPAHVRVRRAGSSSSCAGSRAGTRSGTGR